MKKPESWIDENNVIHTDEPLERRKNCILFWCSTDGAWISKSNGESLPEHGFYRHLATARRVFGRIAK